MNNNLATVDEFNIKDMRVFEADWKLENGLSSFSAAEGYNNVFIAGGDVRNKAGKMVESEKVFQIKF